VAPGLANIGFTAIDKRQCPCLPGPAPFYQTFSLLKSTTQINHPNQLLKSTTQINHPWQKLHDCGVCHWLQEAGAAKWGGGFKYSQFGHIVSLVTPDWARNNCALPPEAGSWVFEPPNHKTQRVGRLFYLETTLLHPLHLKRCGPENLAGQPVFLVLNDNCHPVTAIFEHIIKRQFDFCPLDRVPHAQHLPSGYHLRV